MTSNQCLFCQHFTGNKTCQAFPNGIPDKIFEGKNHDKVVKGQAGKFVYTEIDLAKLPKS